MPRGQKHVPTTKLRREIECFASYGIPQANIARCFGVPLKTLQRHYKDELELGHDRANAQVAGFLFAAAQKGNVTAMIFWLKTRARWSEVREANPFSELGKKEAALAQAQQPDLSSPVGEVLAAREQRHVGSELSGLARSATAWPLADTRTAA
jgi:hypothetical protein